MVCHKCNATKNVKYFERLGFPACPDCDSITPDKVRRIEFEIAYWGTSDPRISPRFRFEVYEDYLFSSHTLRTYCNLRPFSDHVARQHPRKIDGILKEFNRE